MKISRIEAINLSRKILLEAEQERYGGTMHERHKQFAIHKRQKAELYWSRVDKFFGIIKLPFWIIIKCISFTFRIIFLMPIILLQKIICGLVTCFVFWGQLPVRKMFREIFCYPITEAIEESLTFNYRR